MKRGLVTASISVCVFFLAAAFLRAEVKTEEMNQFKMEGMMGRMMGMFGGKAAKDGVVSTAAVKGNRKMTTSENRSEIIDLDEQKIYDLDLKKRTYQVMTFDEMRRRLRESQEEMAEAMKEQEKQPSEKEMEFDFSLKESGEKRSINGYDCREVVMTITGREKGKSLEEAGGMVMTSHMWLGPEIPAMKEMLEFDQRYAKALDMAFGSGSSAQQMAMAMAMYPGMKEMIGKMQTENVNMQGAQILTETTMETVRNPAQVSQEQKQESESSGIRGGIGGMLGRRLSRKKESEGDASTGRSTVFTTRHELLKVITTVADAEVAIPTGFKEKK